MPLYLTNKTLSDYQIVTDNMAEADGNQKLAQAQAQVGEVVDVMRVNVEKVLERDSKLSDLNSRADHLQAGANQFQTQVRNNIYPTVSLLILSSIPQGNQIEEEILVAEHEDDDDYWSCRPHSAHNYHCLCY